MGEELRIAARRLEILARPVLVGNRLTNPRFVQAAGIKRHIDLHADEGLPLVEGVGELRRTVAGRLVEASDEIQRWIISGALFIDLQRGDTEVVLRDTHLGVVPQRFFNPRVELAWRGRLGVELAAEALQFLGGTPNDGTQRGELVVEIVAYRDLLRHDLIVLSLGIVGVGDGGGANLEVTFGLRQVFADRRLLALGELDVELRQ